MAQDDTLNYFEKVQYDTLNLITTLFYCGIFGSVWHPELFENDAVRTMNNAEWTMNSEQFRVNHEPFNNSKKVPRR